MKARTYICWIDEIDGDTIYARNNSFSFEIDRQVFQQEDWSLLQEGAGFYIVTMPDLRTIFKIMKPFVITPGEMKIVEKKAHLLKNRLQSLIQDTLL
jgi:hypothetical protein